MNAAWSAKISSNDLDLETVVRTHYDDVWRFCFRRVGADLAGDAAQETFVIVQRKIHSFRAESGIRTWILGIAQNVCRNLGRKHRREIGLEWFSDLPGPESNSLIDREALRAALSKLSHEHREVVILHEIEELSYDEIAEVLSIPAGTVKSRLHYAFLQLRNQLQGSVN